MPDKSNNLSGIVWKKSVHLARGNEWFQVWRWDAFLVFYGYRYQPELGEIEHTFISDIIWLVLLKWMETGCSHRKTK